jgi:hypothetical protein
MCGVEEEPLVRRARISEIGQQRSCGASAFFSERTAMRHGCGYLLEHHVPAFAAA